jgi:hypothetical protein
MHYLGENEMTQMMGGYLGEMRQGTDGRLYQWVEGMDGLGNPIGFWKKLKRFARKALPYAIPGGAALKLLRAAAPALQQVMPIAQQAASLIPGGTAALTELNPLLRQAGIEGYDGLGALYEAPDGNLYQMQGLAVDEEGLGSDELMQMMGIGHLGQIQQAPDGQLYQWMEGIDGLGNPIGFWKKLRRFVKKALPIAQKFATFVPGYGPAIAAGLRVATPILQQAGVAGYEGLGALYQAPDNNLYQMQGLAEDEDLRGFAEQEELQGYGEGEALYGYGEGEDMQGYGEGEALYGYGEGEDMQGYGEGEALYGYGEGEDIQGYGEGEDIQGYGEGEDMQGYGEGEDMQGIEGYIRQNGMSGLEKYVPQQPPMTPGVARTQTCWNPPW